MRWLFIMLLSTTMARAEADMPGEFDYYVLALSWSPTWCALQGDARASVQCAPEAGFGWVLHGLWPQYENGWPSYCQSGARPPSRGETAAMADIMGTAGAAWHQWKKHGVCSGLGSQDYFRLMRQAYESVSRPPVFRKLTEAIRLPALVVEQAFLQTNPGLEADMITITCKAGRIQEARLCLTRNLEPRTCGADVVRDCTMDRALFAPVR